jgi:nucleoid-associated protein YgaU
MTTYTPVLPEFDPVLQPIGYALAHEFLGGIVVDDEAVETAPPAPAAPVEAAPVVAEQPEIEEIAAEESGAEEAVTADAGAIVELLIPVPTSLHGSPIDWFAPTAADDEDEDGPDTGFVVRRAS